MNQYKRAKLNKILIIVASVLVVIAIIATSFYIALRNKKDENIIDYEDTIVGKNYFVDITINLENKQIKRDETETTLQEEFDIDDNQANLILSSTEELKNFFENSTIEVKIEEGIAHLTDTYQTKKILLEADQVKDNFDALEESKIQDGLYILKYDTQKRTKAAYEYLKSQGWVKKVQTDEISLIKTINDESQTVYGQVTESEDTEYKSYGVNAMGLDNYQKIIKENGNPAEVVVATIGYGAQIDNQYFENKISEDYYNFIENSKDIYETIPQGSRVLEVIKESTTDNIKITPLVVINDENYTTTSSIIQAISYATQTADVICYEFIQKQNYMINLVLQNAFKENVPVCCVTKMTTDDEEMFPANNATTIAVSSVDKSLKTTSYSGSGDYIDFVASSTDVEEIFDKSSTVSKWSGAQYSNAHIVSAIALIKTYNKDYTILEIYNMIRNYCKDLGDEGKDNIYGYGYPDFSSLKISDIDKNPPEIQEVNFSDENWELVKYVQIKAIDNIKIYGWAVTKSKNAPNEWNKLETNSNTLDIAEEISENGTYYIWVTDSAGNASYMNIEVTKIDKIAPNIQYTIDDSKKDTEKYVTINVTATDEQSGLHEMSYSWDKQSWGSDNNTLKVTENGRYKVYVRDALENISEKEIVVNSLPQEGTARIEDGTIIKSIVVSSKWEGNTNKEVSITFNNNLNIESWKITDSNVMPKEFEATEDENEPETDEDIDLENSNNLNTINNIENNIAGNYITNSINETTNNTQTTVTATNNDTLQGYTNLTVTVSLKANKKYYAWIKDKEGNVISQAFTISKTEI